MPNVIKSGTTLTNGSIYKGQFTIGVNTNVDFGPTSSTSFWNGVIPESNGYAIYQTKASDGPSIRTASNDTQLVSTMQSLGSTGSTAANVLDWGSQQSNIMVANLDYPSIVTSGLTVGLDAGYVSSYPKTGVVWRDLSINGINSTLTNGPTYSSSNSGLIITDGTNDFISIPGSSTLYSSDFTWQAWHFMNTANASDLNGMWWSEVGGSKNFLMGYRNTNLINSYFRIDTNATVYQSLSVGTNFNGFGSTAGAITGRWLFTTIVKSGTTFSLYWNNSTLMWQVTISNWNIVAPSQATAFAAKNDGAFASNMNLSNILMYNRPLSTTEITQNYNAYRTRFGL